MSNETPMITQKKWNAKLRELRVANERIAAITAERDTEREKRRLIEAQHVRLCDEVYEQDGETLRQDSLQAECERLKERLATVRAETIEECAEICRFVEIRWEENDGHWLSASDCEDAIRALAQKEAGASAAKPDDVPGDGVLPK